MFSHLYNNQNQKTRRQKFRKSQTEAEEILWEKIRNRQINSLKFYRQYSVGPYILDFFCPTIRLCIELDGAQHQNATEYDSERANFLKDKDIVIIRFWNNEVIGNIERVCEIINNSSQTLPLQQGKGLKTKK